jgi:CHAD domain-containing protein
MEPGHSVETELKFDVPRPELSPPLRDVPGVETVDAPEEHRLEAQYFDTPDLALAAHRITLRRRTGGDDAGWHLKLPLEADSRREIREPLGTGDAPPEPLIRRISVHLRGRDLIPVARLTTSRVVHRLRGPGNTILAEVSDDHVHAQPLLPGQTGHDWREWEVELVHGSRELLDAVQARFATAGVQRASYASKLGRALGGLYPEPASGPPPHRDRTIGGLLRAYVDANVGALLLQDPQVRDHAPDAVHQMRVATRRLRSALATHRRVLEQEPAAALRAELKWLAGVLGEVRDTEVMRERLRDLLAAEPAELVMGPVSRRLEEDLSVDYRAGYNTLLETMNHKRYFQLLDDLEVFRDDPALTDQAARKPKTVGAAIGKDGKRLRRAVNAAASRRGTAASDEALHEARKAAKRLRYAAEAAAVIDRKQARLLEKAAHSIQKVLGRHQDSVVARDLLRRLAAAAFLQGENAFTYGRLHALEQNQADQTEDEFHQAWATFPAKLLK